MKISFENIIIKKGYIKAEYCDEMNSHFIEFELSDAIMIREDLIALALATLCGTKYNDIHMELSINQNTQKAIKKFTKANLHCKTNTITNINRKNFGNHTLNFSGGIDSLASLPFLPNNSSLIFMNFGGPFKRELNMIKNFSCHIVNTNILETDFRKNSWLFMFIGTILYKDYLNTTYNISGGVIGAGFLNNTKFAKNYSTPVLLRDAGMASIPYTLALSEIAAIKLAINHYPDLISESLVSLANPKEEKRYRKQLLIQLEIERSNLDIDLQDLVPPPTTPHFKWGDNILLDYLSIYVMKHKDYETAQLTLKDIPYEAYELSKNFDLNFYDRYYTDVFKLIPKPYRNKFFKTLNEARIMPYEENDWHEYRGLIKFLSNYHQIN